MEKRNASKVVLCWVAMGVVLALLGSAHGLIHNLDINDDFRGSFFIESFGFEGDGKLKMSFSNLKVFPPLSLQRCLIVPCFSAANRVICASPPSLRAD